MTKESQHIFVCGAGHSGTTLMLAILDSHPMISCVPRETGVFLKDCSDEKIYAMVSEWRERFNLITNIIAEKTPSHIKVIDRIFKIFPGSKIIIMIRDGRDVACSASHRLPSFEAAVNAWTGANAHALRHFGDARVKVIKYEDLIADQSKLCMELCSFVGIAWSESMLYHYKYERKWYDTVVRCADPNLPLIGQTHKTHRNWQINQPIFDGRDKWKSEMTKGQRVIFESLAGNMLIKLGYADSRDWILHAK